MSSRKPVRGAAKRRKLEPRRITEQPGSHSATLESHLNLLNQEKLSDVTFIVGEGQERIPCHQLFLKARSSVFEVMFSERWNQEIPMEAPLVDAEPKAFKMFLRFIYADVFEANVPEALELLHLANKYDVQLLVSKCEKVLESKVTLSNSLRVFQAARKYNKIQLMDKAGDLLTKSLPKMPTHPSFTQLDKETLMYLLNRTDLDMKEVDLFRLALQWARNQKDATVEESLKDILPLIRFPIMPQKEFTTAVVSTGVLPQSTVIDLFTYFGLDGMQKKLLGRKLPFSTQKRQQVNSIVYAALYSDENIADGTTMWQQFKSFKESLQFYIKVEQVCRGDPQERSLGYGLKLISLYCPANATTGTQSGRATTSLKGLQMCLKAKDCRGRALDLHSSTFYKKLFSWPSFQIEQGKITDIQLDTVIPLNMDTIYCITIEEITSVEGDLSAQAYNAKDFGGNPYSSIDVNFDKDHIWNTDLNVRRNKLQGFVQDTHRLTRPHLICRLGFQEL